MHHLYHSFALLSDFCSGNIVAEGEVARVYVTGLKSPC